MSKETLNFSAAVDKRDLKDFCSSLYKQNMVLLIENEKLKSKVEHLEELLKYSEVLEIGT